MPSTDSINSIAAHMRALGLGALAHANWHANYWSYMNDYWPELSVVQAAHVAELLIKARIAEEHPLLIFEKFPKISEDTILDQSPDRIAIGVTELGRPRITTAVTEEPENSAHRLHIWLRLSGGRVRGGEE